MTTVVKICGLKTPEAIDAAIAGGADMIGLVFYPPSPRSLEPEAAAENSVNLGPGRNRLISAGSAATVLLRTIGILGP